MNIYVPRKGLHVNIFCLQMLVEDQDGQKLVVVNPGPGEEPQTIVVPEQVMITSRLFINRH